MMADKGKKTGEEPPQPQAAVPEVDAEVVEETDAAGAAAGFDGGADGPGPEAETPTAGEAAKKPVLTPGVILFLAFTAAALAAFALWRLLGGGAVPEKTAAEPAVVEENAPPIAAEKAPAGPAAGEESANAPTAAAPTDAAKIVNDAATAVKRAADDAGPAGDGPQADDTFLPPLPGAEPNKAGQRPLEAKEALRQSDPDAQSASGIEGFEFEGETQGASDGEPSSDAPAGAADRDEAAAAVDQKIDNADLAALKQSFRAETERLSGALADERARSAALGEEIAAMRRDFEAALAARDARADATLADLRAEIEKLRNGDDLTAAKRAAGAAALDALEAAAAAGRPFAAELDRLARIAPDAAPLGVLRRYAETGAPARDALKESFNAAAREGLAAAGRERAGAGFLAQLGARVSAIISVRPAAPRAGPGPRAVMSRAEAAVKSGDFAAALAEIESLPAGAQAAMAGWTQSARARADVDQALTALGALFLVPAGEAR